MGFCSGSVYFKSLADTKLTSALVFNLLCGTWYVGVKDREVTVIQRSCSKMSPNGLSNYLLSYCKCAYSASCKGVFFSSVRNALY